MTREFADSDKGVRNWITIDGKPGLTGNGGFKAERNRYHLYASKGDPLSHRVLMYRKLKGLDALITVSYVDGMGSKGWEFDRHSSILTSDELYHSDLLSDIYLKFNSKYTGIVSVPVLWDKKLETIVSTDSGDMMRMFNVCFNDLTGNTLDFYPKDLQKGIDEISEAVDKLITFAGFKTAMAKTQEEYDKGVLSLFEAFDRLELRLGTRRFLVGDRVTEADWRLFPTLFRFDSIYYTLFKCNMKRIVDYPALWSYTRDLFQMDGIAETCDLEYSKKMFYSTFTSVNTKIVPRGPVLDFMLPPNRESVGRMPLPEVTQRQKMETGKEAQKAQQEVLEKEATGRIR
jgi:putative glutathione S-transferase